MQLNRTLQPAILAISISTRSWPTFALMIGADVLALSLAWMGSVYGRMWVEEQFHPWVYWQLCPMLGLFLLAYAVAGLYPGVANSPVDELRRTSLSTTLIYLVLFATLFLRREGEIYSREVFIIAWALSVVLVLLFRALVRLVFAPQAWWGYPVMVLGAGKTGEMVIKTLKRRPGIGLKPVLVLDDDPKKHGALQGVPVVGGVERWLGLAKFPMRSLQCLGCRAIA
jgi:FlaA1/EpsC-like NDP-sugar epimerase